MNVYERRALELAQTSNLLASVAREGQKIVNIEFFSYNLTFGALAAGASAQGRIQFQSNSDFVVTYLSAETLDTDLVTCQITDQGSGKTFFNQPTLVGLAFGTGGFPFLLPSPKVIEPSTNVTIDLTNVSSGTAMSGAYFMLAGGRIFYAN